MSDAITLAKLQAAAVFLMQDKEHRGIRSENFQEGNLPGFSFFSPLASFGAETLYALGLNPDHIRKMLIEIQPGVKVNARRVLQGSLHTIALIMYEQPSTHAVLFAEILSKNDESLQIPLRDGLVFSCPQGFVRALEADDRLGGPVRFLTLSF